MAMAASILSFSPSCSPRVELKADKPRRVNFSVQAKGKAPESQNDYQSGGGAGGSGRQIWRRRKLKTIDYRSKNAMERMPFLEEKLRKIRGEGQLVSLDAVRLLRRMDNRFAFVNEVAAEAASYVNKNRDEYGSKKAIYHVISNRMNEAGFYRPEAYLEDDPFKPGPGYVRDDLKSRGS